MRILLAEDDRVAAEFVVKGPGGTKLDPVGHKVTLHAKGTYRITMVRQAPDDNHLVLRVK